MARKKIREYDGKRILREHMSRFSKLKFPAKSAQISGATDYDALAKAEPWLLKEKLVCKPDVLFGKRGKHNLVLLNATYGQVQKWVAERLDKEMNFDDICGVLSHFIVEPFVPHKTECYLSITSKQFSNTICFSTAGGVEIEENWDKVKTIEVSTNANIDKVDLKELTAGLEEKLISGTHEFIRCCFKVFEDLDFTMMEFNPFCFQYDLPLPLYMRGELDDTALFKQTKKWGGIEFPAPFGRAATAEEATVRNLDERTGASLKLTVLNPKGRIWNMVAGGGASVIYADTVADLGYAKELGNYGEYSGAPGEEETFQYSKTLLDLCTRDPVKTQGRALVIGGGIANFTDVAVTFKGIIRALKEFKQKLQDANVRVFVRRGGPNYQTGLKMMEKLGKELGVPFEVYGPETNMTSVVSMAIESLNRFDNEHKDTDMEDASATKRKGTPVRTRTPSKRLAK